jgi:hypothetical protein
VATHAIRDRHKQSAIFNPDKSRLGVLRNTPAVQGENQMIVLIVAPSAAHIGDVNDPRAKMEDAFVFAAKRRYFWRLIRHQENSSLSSLWAVILRGFLHRCSLAKI